METVRAIAIGLSVTFLIWTGAMTFASSRLIWANWPLMRRWRQQSRNTRVTLALWVAVPGLKLWLFWMRAIVLWVLVTNPQVVVTTPFAIVQSVFVLPFVLVIMALLLWYVCDRVYGADLGDRVWWWLILSGLGLGDVAAVLFWGLS